MFGIFKRKSVKPGDCAGDVSSSANGDTAAADVVLTGFRKLPSCTDSLNATTGTSGEAVGSTQEEVQDVVGSGDMSSNCRCSPLLSFQKHLFGSFKGRQKNGNVPSANKPSTSSNTPTAPSSSGDASCVPADVDAEAYSLAEVHHNSGSFESSQNRTSENSAAKKTSVNDGLNILNEVHESQKTNEQSNLPPPRLMRREKARTTDVPETRKSRLSAQLRENDALLVDAAARGSPLIVEVNNKGRDRLPVCNENEHITNAFVDCMQSSTEPSSASSTDSGIQPSLYSSSDDKNSSSVDHDYDYEVHPAEPRCNGMKVLNGASMSECGAHDSRQHDPVLHSQLNSCKRTDLDYASADVSSSKFFSDDDMLSPSVQYSCVQKFSKYGKGDDVLSNEPSHVGNQNPAKIDQSSHYSTADVNGARNSSRTYVASHKLVMNDDDDDDDFAPPLPSRNYANSNLRTCAEVFISSRQENGQAFNKSDDSSNQAVDDSEQTHMSWAEVIKEAQALGIPLSGPKAESSNSLVTSMTSLEMTDPFESCPVHSHPIDRMTVSEIGMSMTDGYGNNGDFETAIHSSSLKRVTSETKTTSPFKDKFRLQNLFAKRKNRRSACLNSAEAAAQDGSRRLVHRHSSAAATVDIQRRNLPALPANYVAPDGNYASGNGASINNGFDHIPMSMSMSVDSSVPPAQPTTLTLPARDYPSAVSRQSSSSGRPSWNGSSVSIRSSGAVSMSASRISSGSMASMVSHESTINSSTTTLNGDTTDGNSNVDFMQSFIKLRDCGWYWGPLGWEEAEMRLVDKPDGSFLVRDSSDDRYILSISFRSQGVTHHTRIEHYKGQFSFYSQPKSHGAASIVDFIEKAMAYSRSGQFLYFLRPSAPGLAPAPVQLLHPISRFNTVPSLQHMCRFVIASRVRRDLIDCLPTATSLKEYLKQTQYYAMT